MPRLTATNTSANESLKSKILRRVREEECREVDSNNVSGAKGRTMPVVTNGRGAGAIQKQEQLGSIGSRPTKIHKTRQQTGKTNSSLSLSRSKSTSGQYEDSKLTPTSSSYRPERRSRRKGRVRTRHNAGGGRQIPQMSIKEAWHRLSVAEGIGHSSQAKSKHSPRRLRSSNSVAIAPPAKIRKIEANSTPQTSPSVHSAQIRNSWNVTDSPHSLVIAEKKSPGYLKKIKTSGSAEAFCFCSTDASCSRKQSSRKKRCKVQQTKQKTNTCSKADNSTRKIQPKSDATRSRTSKHDKNEMHETRSAHGSSKYDEQKKPRKVASHHMSHSNVTSQPQDLSTPTSSDAKSLSKRNSPDSSEKENGRNVREIIKERINQTLDSDSLNDKNNDATLLNEPNEEVIVIRETSQPTKHHPLKTNKQLSTYEEESNDCVTVTKTAAAEAAKAVGGISVVPLLKPNNSDFLPTASSPCTPTMTFMRASSDQTIPSTKSSAANADDHKTTVTSDKETFHLSPATFCTNGTIQNVAQCKSVTSMSTAPTPSVVDIANVKTGQPIYLSPDSYQFQTISYPGNTPGNVGNVTSAVCLQQTTSKPNKKRPPKPKKKLVEKEMKTSVSSLIAPLSAPCHFTPDTKKPDPTLNSKGEKIKRPMNAFMIWSRQQRSLLASQNPKMTNADISVKLGIMWNDLDYSEKQKYFDEAIQLKLQHRKDYPDWVYQPRPQKQRRKQQAAPFYDDGSHPYPQMLLVLPDGRQMLCPAIPQQHAQEHGCQMLCPSIAQQNSQGQQMPTKNTSTVTPGSLLDGKDKQRNAINEPADQTNQMLMVGPDGQQTVFPGVVPNNCQQPKAVETDKPKQSIAEHPGDKNGKPNSQLLLVMPDGKQVLCPAIQTTQMKDVKTSLHQTKLQPKTSEEKPMSLQSDKSSNRRDEKDALPFSSQSGLPAGVINLGPLKQFTKDVTCSYTKTVATSPSIPKIESAYSASTDQQQTGNFGKNNASSFHVATVKCESERSLTPLDDVNAKTSTIAHSELQKIMEMVPCIKSDDMPIPIAITTSVQVKPVKEEGNTQSICMNSDYKLLDLSNQKTPLIKVNSSVSQPFTNKCGTQINGSLKEKKNASKPQLPTTMKPDPRLQVPVNKDRGVQTTQDLCLISSSTGPEQINQTQPETPLPSSILKEQPIDMVWNSESKCLLSADIVSKGTTTPYNYYFTPIQQVAGVQDTSTAPSIGSPGAPMLPESCTGPPSTTTLTDNDGNNVTLPGSHYADTPALCEISEPDRLLESLAMSAVELSEDETEETENLFQRVMSMVSN